MRIIHVVPAIGEEASGPSYSVPSLCRSLGEAGCEIELAAMDLGGPAVPPGFARLFRLGRGPRRLGCSPAMRHWLREQCATGSVQVLHNHGMWQVNALYASWIAPRHGTKLIASPRGALSPYAMGRGSIAKPLFWWVWQHRALERADCFHATSHAEYLQIRRQGFRQPVAVLPNGIDVPDPPPARSRTGRRVVTYLGRLHPEKGLEVLLTAWQQVERRFADWDLHVIGPGHQAYIGRLHAMARELGLTRVVWRGAVYGEAKWQVLAASDLYVLPSPSENFGMTVAEALACGVPVIATTGSPWHGLRSTGAGWWIDIGVPPLVAALEDALAQERDVLDRMGLLGSDWMQRDFSWTRIGQQMMEVYAWMTGQQPDRPSCVLTD